LDKTIVYLISGRAHLPNLVISILDLRTIAGWKGNIEVHAWPESLDIVNEIATDRRLDISVHERKPKYRGKNAQFLDKTKMMQQLTSKRPTESFIYLDADTSPVKPIDELFEMLEYYSFITTQFNLWTIGKGTIQKRVARLLEHNHMPRKMVIDCIADFDFPSLNGGIWGVRGESKALAAWSHWTDLHKTTLFIADEVCLHPVAHDLRETDACGVATGGLWNASSKYLPRSTNRSDVKIWHFHGDSNLRPDKSPLGFELWWPRYLFALENKVGKIDEWWNAINNKHLRRREKEAGFDTCSW